MKAPKKGKGEGRTTTRSSTSRAEQSAHKAAVKVEARESHAQRKLGDIDVCLSDVSSVNPDPEAKALQGRAPRKVLAAEDIQKGTLLAYFYYKAYEITPALEFHPDDSGVDLEKDGTGLQFFHDKDWATNAWYAADHMGDANSKLVPGTVGGIDAVILVATAFIRKGSEIGHRYTFPQGMGVPEAWQKGGVVSASRFPDEVKLAC